MLILLWLPSSWGSRITFNHFSSGNATFLTTEGPCSLLSFFSALPPIGLHPKSEWVLPLFFYADNVKAVTFILPRGKVCVCGQPFVRLFCWVKYFNKWTSLGQGENEGWTNNGKGDCFVFNMQGHEQVPKNHKMTPWKSLVRVPATIQYCWWHTQRYQMCHFLAPCLVTDSFPPHSNPAKPTSTSFNDRLVPIQVVLFGMGATCHM